MEETTENPIDPRLVIRLVPQELDWIVNMLMHGQLPANYSTVNTMIQKLVALANSPENQRG